MTISVVIPAYNEEQYLRACLDSLTRQTRPPDEILIVDNNSTDATADIAGGYAAVTVITETVQGIMPASYAGFTASTGDIIARCDADSILPADWLEVIEKTLAKNPDAAGITGPGTFYGTNAFAAAAAQVWYMYAYFVLVGSALANWPLFGSNCALRRRAWETIQNDIHKSRTDIHDDIDISMHLRPTERIILARGLKVRISARSLRTDDLRSRYKKGFTSLTIHWPGEYPWMRWRQRLEGK